MIDDLFFCCRCFVKFYFLVTEVFSYGCLYHKLSNILVAQVRFAVSVTSTC